MKKIDIKKTLEERVRDTEWTDANTWNVLRKIRGAKSARSEFSLRRLAPAAVALLLVMGIGIATLTGTPGNPDSIRDKAQYTAQPIVTVMAAGQGEGNGDLPEGEGTEKSYLDALREYYPEVADQLMPVNRSCEKNGTRLDLISGLVKGDETWVLYSLQDLEGKYPGTTFRTMLMDNMGDPDYGEDQVLYVDEKEHKVYFYSHNHHIAPISTEARMITMGISHYEAYRMVKLDALQLLKEHGITSEGVLSPERLPGVNEDGTPLIHEKVKVLDYNQPQLDIPVIGDVVLTGIGWVDGEFHAQFHNPKSRPIIAGSVTETSNWDVYPDWESDYWKDGLIECVVWDENGDESMDWSEIVLHCDQEHLEKMEPQLKVFAVDGIEADDWIIDLPLNLICAESEPVEVETKSSLLDEEIAYDFSEFFRDWAAGDAELMWGDVTMEWRLSREDGEGSLRSLIASGIPRCYQINDVIDGASDGEKIITCTVEMDIPGEESPVFRRYRVPVKPAEYGFYQVDPAGFIDWEVGEYDPAMEMVLVDQTTVLNKVQSDGYSDPTKYMELLNLICEKQGIRLNVLSGGVRDQEGWFVCAVEDTEGAYAEYPIDPVFSGNFGAEAEVTATRMYRNALGHYAVYMVYVKYKQPVGSEDCTVTLNMDSVMVHEGAQADLMPLLKKHAKAAEGVELPQLAKAILQHRDRGANDVPDLKVLDYTQPLNIPLFKDTYLSNVGWIDGKLHVQICQMNWKAGGDDALWINTLLGGEMDILRKEADYSPVDWYDDKVFWYEYIFDYTSEDLEQLEMTVAFLDSKKKLTDDWTVSFPLNSIREESKAEKAEAGAEDNSGEDNQVEKEIIKRLNAFYSCWIQRDKEGMLALCKPKKDNSGYQNVTDYMLEFGELLEYNREEIEVTGDEDTRSLHSTVLLLTPDGKDHLYYVDFKMEKADDGLWYVNLDEVHFYLVNPLQGQSAEGDFTIKGTTDSTPSPAPAERSGRPVRVDLELGKDKLSGPETIDVTITVTNVSGDKLAGPVTLYDPDGNQVAEYSNEDFAAGETKEWSGKWTVTEEQLADGKVGFSVKYTDYKEGTQDIMAHKLTFSKPISKE